jgi:hypothetical protein
VQSRVSASAARRVHVSGLPVRPFPGVGRVAAAMTTPQPDAPAWWLCPNRPRCPHGAVLHDIRDHDDPLPRCCADGCDCGSRASYAALCQDIRDLAPAAGEATPWAFHQLITDTARMIDKGGFDMTCQRCGAGKAADGDDWCARCEDEDAAQALAALRGAPGGSGEVPR